MLPGRGDKNATCRSMSALEHGAPREKTPGCRVDRALLNWRETERERRTRSRGRLFAAERNSASAAMARLTETRIARSLFPSQIFFFALRKVGRRVDRKLSRTATHDSARCLRMPYSHDLACGGTLRIHYYDRSSCKSFNASCPH